MTSATDVGRFLQDAPRLTNTYDADAALRDVLDRLLPSTVRAGLEDEWRSMGERAAGELLDWAREAEATPPRHVAYDAWGRRVDRIETCEPWKRLHVEAVRRGLTAIPYEGKLGAFARIHQFALLHLYSPSSAIYSCPLAMTDGAARALLTHADEPLIRRAVPHLTSRDPAVSWTSGQWMTESAGGSDVSGATETVARQHGDRWRLYGTKWFTSAATSEMTLTLARIESPAGPRGLTMFYLEQRLEDGSSNGVVIHRLKDKLGTRALPTAELSLEGTLATPVGAFGDGVKTIAPVLNITRLHNAINACGLMARVLQLLRDYAARRVVFDERLAEKPAFRETLGNMQVEYEAALALTFEAVRLQGRVEAGEATDPDRRALRALTPIAKLVTAKQAVAVISEALEGFGGAGYVEDTGLPVILRNAQVLPIWEGTTDVLSLDVLRTIGGGAWVESLRDRMSAAVAAATAVPALGHAASQLSARWNRFQQDLRGVARGDRSAESGARALAMEAGTLLAALVLIERAVSRGEDRSRDRHAAVATRWLERHSAPPTDSAADRMAQNTLLGRIP